MSEIGTYLYPQVTSIPSRDGMGDSATAGAGRATTKQGPGEFDQIFDKYVQDERERINLGQIKAPLKFSAHSLQRLRDRNILLDPQKMAEVSRAVEKAEAKGLEEALVLTDDVAWIVSVKNKTVITALDKGSLSGNVFTNIDGAVIV